jgi:diguanylate cyclase (GGDEF)-like protein
MLELLDATLTLAGLPGWARALSAGVALFCLASALWAVGFWWQRRRGQRAALPHESRGKSRQPMRTDSARDPLTGLATRGTFDTALEEATWQAEHEGGAAVAVLHIGIDELRSINDGWGRHAGDEVLVQIGQRLAQLPSAAAQLAARIGGEDFALLLACDEAGAIAMAAHLCETLGRPVDTAAGSGPSGPSGAASTAAGPIGLTVSVGVACYPAHGAWSRLLPHAAAAMRHVKQAGGNGHAVYTPAMAVDLREQALLLHDLRQAVQRGELRLLYQPKIDAASLQITAAEALVRWEHPVRGVVPPAVFIPLAERHGLMGSIGDWVVAEACRQAAAWRQSGLRMRIAVNISGHQLRHDRFVAELEALARQHQIPPSRLTCEITESVAMEDTTATRTAFQRLRRAGFHVSIDDFGTGHSSLAVLRRLPAAELKVDRNFVVDLEASESARSIVEAVLSVARTLGMRVVAEGVETEGQRDILVRMGCDELQGFLFARPMSATALALWAEGSGPLASGCGTAAAEFRASLFDATQPAPIARGN